MNVCRLYDIIMSQSVSSTFELADYGENRMLLDTVQYFLDGICATTSNTSRRRLCLWKLLELYSKNADKLRSLSQSRDLLSLPALLISEQDPTCAGILCLLTLSLLRSQSGTISLLQELPEFSFQALCTHAVTSLSLYITQDGQHEVDKAQDHVLLEKGLAPMMHLKRKFRAEKKAQSFTEINADTPDIWEAVPTNVEQLTNTFSNLCPEMARLLCINGSLHDSRTNKIFSGLMALVLVCRTFFFSVEYAIEYSPNKRSEAAYSRTSAIENFQRIICAAQASNDKFASMPFLFKFRQLFSTVVKCCRLEGEAFAGTDLDALVLWNLVSLFESVCFRAPQFRSLSSDLHDGFCLPCDVFDLLQSLTKIAFKSIADDFISTVAGLASKKSQVTLNSELQTLHMLFPELNETNSHLNVQKRDLWLSCLKLLVNLSHDCSSLMWAFQRSNEGVTLIITCFLFATRYRSAIRLAKTQSLSSNQADALSSGELPFEKFVYDVCLYLLSLLTNIVESSDAIDNVLLPEDAKCMQACDMGSFLPDDALFAQHKRYFPSSERGKSALLNALLNTLEIETFSFVDEFKESTKASEHCTPQPTASSKHLFSPKAPAHNRNTDLPVADLILSGHTSLLLFSLAQKRRGDLPTERIITNCLPYSNWWLPMRTLKAFLSLQMHSGVMVVENIAPVVYAIRCMEQGVLCLADNGLTPNQSESTNAFDVAHKHSVKVHTLTFPLNSEFTNIINEGHPKYVPETISLKCDSVQPFTDLATNNKTEADCYHVHSTPIKVYGPTTSHFPQQSLKNVSNAIHHTNEEWLGFEPPKAKRKFGHRG